MRANSSGASFRVMRKPSGGGITTQSARPKTHARGARKTINLIPAAFNTAMNHMHATTLPISNSSMLHKKRSPNKAIPMTRSR